MTVQNVAPLAHEVATGVVCHDSTSGASGVCGCGTRRSSGGWPHGICLSADTESHPPKSMMAVVRLAGSVIVRRMVGAV